MAVTWGYTSVKESGWAKGTGLLLFLCLHSKRRGCLDVGQIGALLVQSEENKERWKMKGWKEEEQRREGEARTERGSLFSSDTEAMFLAINIFISMQRVLRKVRICGIFAVFVLALFLIKHFTCSSKSNSPRRTVTGIEQNNYLVPDV